MAVEGVCPWPSPPAQYFKLYTDENVESKRTPEPPPPIEGSYSMFGGTFQVKYFCSILFGFQRCFPTKVTYLNM